MLDAPEEYKQRHPVLVSELHNVTHWPKHVLVHYRFDTRNDVDLDRGLYVLFPIGEWTESLSAARLRRPVARTWSSGWARCRACARNLQDWIWCLFHARDWHRCDGQ